MTRSESSTRTKARRILLVEADARLRELLAGALADEGFDVTSVSDSLEARKILFPTIGTIGLVVLDLATSDARALVHHYAHEARSVPIVATATNPSEALDVANTYSIPALAKPFELTLFVATVFAAFDNDMRPRPRKGSTLRRQKRIA